MIGLQYLLTRPVWDAGAVRAELRDEVCDPLGSKDAVVAVDETDDDRRRGYDADRGCAPSRRTAVSVRCWPSDAAAASPPQPELVQCDGPRAGDDDGLAEEFGARGAVILDVDFVDVDGQVEAAADPLVRPGAGTRRDGRRAAHGHQA